jgi:hypothetical protein
MKDLIREHIRKQIKTLMERKYSLRGLDPLTYAVLTKPKRNQGLGFNKDMIKDVKILRSTTPTFRVFTVNDEYFDISNLDNMGIFCVINGEKFDLMDMQSRAECSKELDRLLQKGKINIGGEEETSGEEETFEEPPAEEPTPEEPEV